MKILQESIAFQYNKKLNDLSTKVLGKNYIYFKEIDSTQKEIWRKIENKSIVNGTLIRAETQTAGVGTFGRKWYTSENNIAFSFYLKLNFDVEKLDGLTIKIAEIIAKIFKEKYAVKIDIKEPNDLYVRGKKLGGILTETKIKGNIAKYLVIGIGINNQQIIFNDELKEIATSLKKEYDFEINVEEFIVCFCNEFEKIIFERIEDIIE